MIPMSASQSPLVRFWKGWFTPRSSDPTVMYRERALRIFLPIIILLRIASVIVAYAGVPDQPEPYAPLWIALAFVIAPIFFSFYFLARQKVDWASVWVLMLVYLMDMLSLPAEGYWYPGVQISLIIQIILSTLLLPSRAILPFLLFQLVSVGGWSYWLDANYFDPPLLASGQPVALFQRTIFTLAAQETIIMFIVRYLRLQMETYLRLQHVTIQQLEIESAERHHVEEALHESEARYRGMLENIPAIIYIVTVEQESLNPTTYISPQLEKLSGYTSAEFLSDPLFWTNLIHPDDRERVWADSERADQTGEPLTSDYRIITAEQKTLWFHDESVLVKDEQGQPLYRLGIWTDINDRKLAEQEVRELNATLEQRVQTRTAELEAANKNLEAFSYSVSHDLRAPLRGMDGFARILLEDFAPQLPSEAQQHLHRIRQGAKRLGVLIDDLLAFSRLGRQALTVRAVDMGGLVRAVWQELSSEQPNRPIEILMGDLPNCQADRALLKQVWVNLLSNALKYSSKRERAQVEVGWMGEAYFVRDNGAGFDMRYADKLFGVFQRLHRAEEFEGTGVGLAIVQRILQKHGGRIWAEAEPDKGATFYFTL